MVTIKDVAKLADVSISTVSHVINHTKHVQEDTRLRVQQAIDSLGYKTNIFAKNLKSQKSNRIGLIVLDMCGLFFPYVTKEICRTAGENGYTVTLYDSNGSFDRETLAINDLVESSVDGIILSSVVPQAEKSSYAADLHKLLAGAQKSIPLVMMERDFSPYGFDSICTDSYAGARTAMEHLIEIGCKRIGHIAVQNEPNGRLSGYTDILREHHIPYDDACVLSGDFTHESGYVCTKELLKRNLGLDGLFVGNDQMAVGALHALQEANIRVPEDIKVIGFDNIFICDVLNPPLSSIHIAKRQLGQKSISLLLDRINNGIQPSPYKETLEHHLVVRNSTVPNTPLHMSW